jgi:hypothetical protein
MTKARLDKIATIEGLAHEDLAHGAGGIDNLTELRSPGASKPGKPEFWK